MTLLISAYGKASKHAARQIKLGLRNKMRLQLNFFITVESFKQIFALTRKKPEVLDY